MRRPEDAMKAAWTLQISATTFYCVFAAITYICLGDAVMSPSLLSLPPLWSKIAFGVAIPNFLIAGTMYCCVGFWSTANGDTRSDILSYRRKASLRANVSQKSSLAFTHSARMGDVDDRESCVIPVFDTSTNPLFPKLIVILNGVAFVFAVGVPIFNYIVGLTASLFAAWYGFQPLFIRIATDNLEKVHLRHRRRVLVARFLRMFF